MKQMIHQEIVKIINEYQETDSISTKELIENSLQNPNIKITDFGDFCKEDEQYDEEYGTRYYRPPEGILIGETTNKIDVWALGCTIWELLTGKILFDPDKDRNHSRDWYHLHMIENLCGPFSKKFLKSTDKWRKFFDKKGRLNDSNDNVEKISWESLIEKYNVTSDAIDFIKQCLKIKPKERTNISELLNHKWLKVS